MAACSNTISVISSLYSPLPHRLCRAFLHASVFPFSINKYLGASGKKGSVSSCTTEKHVETHRRMFQLSSRPRISLSPKNCPDSLPMEMKVANVSVTMPLIFLGELSPRYIAWIFAPKPAVNPNRNRAIRIISKEFAPLLVNMITAATMLTTLFHIMALFLPNLPAMHLTLIEPRRPPTAYIDTIADQRSLTVCAGGVSSYRPIQLLLMKLQMYGEGELMTVTWNPF